jgi:AI-2E family transporter
MSIPIDPSAGVPELPYPLLWGLLICLLRFVPYIGIFLAAAGPLFLSIAVSPHWGGALWTVLLFLVLELITGNVVEPLLYSSSTGLSPIAVLIAAIFWTLLWGLPGLLLSTPLTVCLVVIGRQVPHLQYLDVLFGDETTLPSPERFYQRLLSSNNHEARALLDDLFAAKSKEQVYDSVVIPVLTLIEESRHAEELTSSRAEEVLLAVEELAEDIASHIKVSEESSGKTPKLVMCIPARDFADEVACQLASHVLTATCDNVPACCRKLSVCVAPPFRDRGLAVITVFLHFLGRLPEEQVRRDSGPEYPNQYSQIVFAVFNVGHEGSPGDRSPIWMRQKCRDDIGEKN